MEKGTNQMENSAKTENNSENITLKTSEINKGSDFEKQDVPIHLDLPLTEEKSFGEKVKFGLLILGIAIAMFMMSLNSTVVAPGLTIIATDLNAISFQSWIATTYLVSMNAFQLLAGKKNYFFTFHFIFFIGSLISALSTSIGILIAGRIIQGFGSGGIFSLCFIVVADIAPLHLRPRFQSMLSSVFGLACVTGPLIGGNFVDKINWHWDFWFSLILSGSAFIIIFFFLTVPKNIKEMTLIEKLKRVDYLGTLFSTSFICCILLALSWGPIYGWGEAHSIGSFIGSGVSLILLVITEGWIPKEPNLPKHIMLNPGTIFVLLYVLALGLGYIGILYFGPIYFQSVFGASSTASGVRLIPYMICLILGSLLSTILIGKIPNIKYYMVIGAAFNVLGFGLFFTVNEYSHWGQQACFLMFCGLAFGITQQSYVLLLQSLVEVKDIAVITSIGNFFISFASSIGVAMYQAFYQVFLKDQFTQLEPEVLVEAQKVGALHNYLFIHLLPIDVQPTIIHAYAVSLHNLFILPLGISAIGLILTLFIPNVRYGGTKTKTIKSEDSSLE